MTNILIEFLRNEFSGTKNSNLSRLKSLYNTYRLAISVTDPNDHADIDSYYDFMDKTIIEFSEFVRLAQAENFGPELGDLINNIIQVCYSTIDLVSYDFKKYSHIIFGVGKFLFVCGRVDMSIEILCNLQKHEKYTELEGKTRDNVEELIDKMRVFKQIQVLADVN